MPSALASPLAVILRPHKPHSPATGTFPSSHRRDDLMDKPIYLQSGTSFQASTFFPRVYVAPTGTYQVDVDFPFSARDVCSSPLGRSLISDENQWVLDHDWAYKIAPLGKWTMRLGDNGQGAYVAPMALILLTRIMLILTNQEDPLVGNSMTGGEIVCHHQHTNAEMRFVCCAIQHGKIYLTTRRRDNTPPARFMATPAHA